jgi:hypothetical protein
MENPIEINAFRHFLEINNIRNEIIEPVGFDANSFMIIQEDGRLGRDTFLSGETIPLTFYQGTYNSGFDLILNEFNLKGNESKVNYILQKNNIDFVVGEIDFETSETDLYSYFKVKLIENSVNSQIKKREKIKIDLFATKDLDDNDITPVQTHGLFIKSKANRC